MKDTKPKRPARRPVRKPAANQALPLLLRADEAAQYCGISARTWRNWDASGRIPRPIHVGHSIFWRPAELEAWVAAGCPDRALWEALRN